jgi:acetylglutamate kinase
MHPIIVHGGGQQITKSLEKFGKKSHFINGVRITDSETMDITQMVLAGLINKNLVSIIEQKGGQAIGLCGKDGKMTLAQPVKNLHNYKQVGEIIKINPKIIKILIAEGYIPVIAPITQDSKGKSLNINADTFATEIALSLKTEKFIFISNLIGIMEDINNDKSIYSLLELQQISSLIKKKIVNKGMIPKLLAAKKALNKGIPQVHFISEKIQHSLLIELFTEEGIGTLLYKK